MKKTFLVALIFLAVSVAAMAQPGDPGGDPDVPITGIEILLGIGGLFGMRQLVRRKKNNS